MTDIPIYPRVTPDVFRGPDDETMDLLHIGALTTPPFPGDCGLDLATRHSAELFEGQTVDFPCGVRVALPPGTFGFICARSSTWSKYKLLIVPGIIDEGWRGELFAMAYRPARYRTPGDTARSSVIIPAGTRLAQLIVLPNLLSRISLTEVDRLPSSERGTHGFGSSGS